MTERPGSPGYEPGLSHQPPTEYVRYQPTEAAEPRQPPTFAAPPSPPPGDADVHQPVTYVVPRQSQQGGALPGEAQLGEAPAPAPAPSDVVRHGPGVPVAGAVAATGAESLWRTGHRPEPPPGRLRLRRARRILGSALTVILLAAAGVVLWLRFHHAPFHVTEVAIIQQTKTACGVDVTGRIATNGSAGTVSYQWVFRPQTQAPQPLSQSVVAGQHAVYVTVAVEGEGHGRATQEVTLDVLGPNAGTASRLVSVSC
ncbi:MAG TPA: hypothetical protein VKU77_17440 [Streptosporangiaceae bacterium]|nr:hypothetical protein [Streptosporangiaceae bacterium]